MLLHLTMPFKKLNQKEINRIHNKRPSGARAFENFLKIVSSCLFFPANSGHHHQPAAISGKRAADIFTKTNFSPFADIFHTFRLELLKARSGTSFYER